MGSIPIGSARSRGAILARRLAALAYDLLVLAGVLMATSFALIVARGGAAIPSGSLSYQAFLALQSALFFVGFWSRGGQTPGMRAWNIRVETLQGAALPLRTAAVRLAGGLLSAAALGLGMAWILLDGDGRAWHDRLTGTRVVAAPRPGR